MSGGPQGWLVENWRRSLPYRIAASALLINAVLLALTSWLMVQQTVYSLEDQLRPDELAAVRTGLIATTGWTAAVFLPLSCMAMYALALQIVRPLREARATAERLTRGELDARMRVQGPEDQADLARSLNRMADELGARLAEQTRMARQQHQFVSDVAHELRTPLTTVRMATDVIYESREEFSPVSARSAELLVHEVDRFENLLSDLLDLSRIDAGAAVLAAEEVDVSQLVADEVEAQVPLAETYGTRLILDGPAGCLASVDALRIRRIVANLLSNAIEHGEGRPVEVHVRASDTAVAIAVRDHGIGLSKAEQQHVFTRFWRADPSRFRTVGGTGLGLAIALENAELHGGRLDLWGEPGNGAQFRLTLPREQGVPMGESPWPLTPEDA